MIEKFFISPNAPLPEIGAKWFVARFESRLKNVPASFDGIIVLSPTRAAAKSLREAIFAECVAKGIEGICELTITTLEDELSLYQDTSKTATVTEIRAAWLSTLKECNLSKFYALFPTEIPKRADFFNVAKEIEFLQNTLAENALRISDAANILADTPDAQRWRDLAELEFHFENVLARAERLTQLQSLKNSISARVQKGAKNIVVMGNPDVSATLKKFLNAIENSGAKIDVAIFAEKQNMFDTFGTPLPSHYIDTFIPLTNEDIRVYADIESEARALANLAKEYGEKVYDTLAIACEQNEAVDKFKAELGKVGVNAITLEAESLEHTSIYSLIRALRDYIESPTFPRFQNFARNPLALKKMEIQTGIDGNKILSDLDFISSESACADISQARNALLARLRSSNFNTDPKREQLLQIKYLRDLFDFADEIISASTSVKKIENLLSYFIDNASDEKQVQAFAVITETLREISNAEKLSHTNFERGEVFEIILEHLKSATIPLKMDDKRLPLQDWMEIFWSPAPHVALCDMNDGIVPLANSDGVFLNDSIRRKLGIRNQQLRQARDTYMLETLILSRKGCGAVTVCVPKRNLKNDPITPSRILFQTPDLPARTRFLFSDTQEIQTRSKTKPEWNLSVEKTPYTGYYTATRLNAYLNSPWQFYLQYVLKMESIEIFKEEIDAGQFGNLFHTVMKNFAYSDIKHSTDAKKIAEFFAKDFDTTARETFGTSPRAQVAIQLENLRNRIIACAKPQAELRAQGWEIESAETPFKFEMFGKEFTGVFDRIDINQTTGERLVIDYKTYDKFTKNIAQDKHVKIKKGEDGNPENHWLNLQLPLYLKAAKEKFGDTKITCAYFVAPKNVSDCDIDIWENIEDFEKSAIEKILKIVEEIENGNFAPTETPKYDNFADVFRIDAQTLKEYVRFDK